MTSIAKQNRRAWEARAYEAWLEQYGPPQIYAAELRETFAHKIRHIAPQLGSVAGLKIANPLGSNGRMAVALALAGAEVTVFDISEPNRKYALELAKAADVRLEYTLGDFSSSDLSAYESTFDAVVIDHGVLHYFTDLMGFVARVAGLLRTNGRLAIHEFHPLSKKLVTVEDGKARLEGDYFAETVEAVPVAYAPVADPSASLPPTLVRRWTLGEIVTAFAEGGFVIEKLLELPDGTAPTMPGSFILTAHLAE